MWHNVIGCYKLASHTHTHTHTPQWEITPICKFEKKKKEKKKMEYMGYWLPHHT